MRQTEKTEEMLTLSLLLVTMDGESGPSVGPQPLGQLVGGALRVDKDEHLALGGGDLLEVRDETVFVR